ncbi:DUF559 domain-containing protein [Labrenzia sp. VG12]|uniref:DUF559 domain-containing protein n=1 Tax=Labrenzia sp. VG12 TaxID=2021862 RepID=UPI00211057AE|nr:DUF559 domain-containing protein [Labrenzia sp. VG12]
MDQRQTPVDRFLVDFLCSNARMTAELDSGQQADDLQADRARTDILENCGFRVIRSWSADVSPDIKAVQEDILSHFKHGK